MKPNPILLGLSVFTLALCLGCGRSHFEKPAAPALIKSSKGLRLGRSCVLVGVIVSAGMKSLPEIEANGKTLAITWSKPGQFRVHDRVALRGRMVSMNPHLLRIEAMEGSGANQMPQTFGEGDAWHERFVLEEIISQERNGRPLRRWFFPN